MKVRITGSTHDYTWYRDRIGKEYHVRNETLPYPHNGTLSLYMVDGDKHPEHRGNGIISTDCEIVNEYKLDEGLFEI